jgi:hypothetical protein
VRHGPLLLWMLLVAGFADHPALEQMSADPEFSQQEIVPLALQYRLEALQSVEHAAHTTPENTADISVLCSVSLEPTPDRPRLDPDPLYSQMSLQC